MTKIISGKEAAAALQGRLRERAAALAAHGTVPTLATVRVGSAEADASYARSIERACGAVGVAMRPITLAEGEGQLALAQCLQELNEDAGVHGILLYRPLPKGWNEAALCALVRPEKDVDGMTPSSAAGVYLGTDAGFAPCTAEACMALLHYAGVSCAGKRAVVIGRSTVVGKPLGMLLLGEHATVTVCHSKTAELPAVCREADILVACAGARELVTASFVKPGAVVLDVGIHWDAAANRLVGDVALAEVCEIAGAMTPVPGGVGAVTSTVLAEHVIKAAERSLP